MDARREIMETALERFIRYAKIDTQSDENSNSTPSAAKELDLSRLLLTELQALGLKAELDQYGRVYSYLPGDKDLPTIGLNAHVDTALEVTGKNVQPQIHENYDGGIIKLNEEYSMSPAEFPSLANHIGDTLITTSGDTLLGADDKAGIAIIMSTIAYYVEHPEIKHYPIAILFTPDEEIGRGPEHFDAKKFGADWAYTIDGANPECIDIETFNAAHAIVKIYGVSIHPGEAKGKLINAIPLAFEFNSLLNPNDKPELTEGYEGFNHWNGIEGGNAEVTSYYIIRNHDAKKLEEQKMEFVTALQIMKARYPKCKFSLTIEDDYRNMKEVFDKDPRAIDHAVKVYKSLGIQPVHAPVRGGTDGATFSFLGCPTPNLGTGSYNHHGRFEYLSLRDFKNMLEIVKALTIG